MSNDNEKLAAEKPPTVEPLTAQQKHAIDIAACCYAFGRFDAGQSPWVDHRRFSTAAIAARAEWGDLKDLYERMLAAGDGVQGDELTGSQR